MKIVPIAMMLLAGVCSSAPVIGERPYEMVWANREEDDHPPFEDFEGDAPWRLEAVNSVATTERTREQQLFGQYVQKLTYRKDGGTPTVVLRPPVQKPVPADFDMVGLWVYGNNWAWAPDPKTPCVNIEALFKTPDGQEVAVYLQRCDWREWFLCIRRLTPEQQTQLHQPGTVFSGIRITNGNNLEDRVLFFDSLTLFKDVFKPLTFAPRARRGIPLFPGQDAGVNTAPDKILPFPNRLDTILPDSACPGSRNDVRLEGQKAVFNYAGDDGGLVVSYVPATGTWTDITAQWNHESPFNPLKDGGVLFPGKNGDERPDKATLLNIKQEGNKIVATWQVGKGEAQTEVAYTFSLRGKTLVIDTVARGGKLSGVTYGMVSGLKEARDVRLPYYSYNYNMAPAIVMAKTGDSPVFVSGHTDWYLSNASSVWGAPNAGVENAWVNGGVAYIPKTNGERNDVYERFFVTISPKFEEHLPNIPNPQSPWKHVAGKVLWRCYGAGNRDSDKKYWYAFWRYGLRHSLIRDHEDCWRDGGESFTFRVKAAPQKGGDAGMYDYARYMQDTLGFVYGPYNNFTDFAPVNEYWSMDMISRTASNQLMGAWTRCYAPKPLRAVEYCEKLSPIIQEKFHFSTAYCDVHTSVTPWGRCDYDWRVPGAGTFAQVFYCFGEIMLLQKKAWNGPVYSEGPHFCFYSGLTDGNYAQDRYYHIADRPWLVDFDLRKIHDLECNFAMGDMGMFLNGTNAAGRYAKDNDARVDRFLTATVAFGHPGYLLGSPTDMRTAFRGYFLLQQIQSRYTQVSATSIRYADAQGKLYPITEAVRNGALNRSQLVVDYADGTHVVANGSVDEMMNVTHLGHTFVLAPNSFECWTDDGKNKVFSNTQFNQRADYAESDDYIYIDGRDVFHAFPKADGVGCSVCRVDDDDHWEIIPLGNADCGFAVDGGDAHAFDYDGKDLGPANLRRCRGLLYVEPVANAVSYKINRKLSTPETKLASDSYVIASGETVTIQTPDGPVAKQLTGKPGERVWYRHGEEWLCFVISELFQTSANLAGNELVCMVRNLLTHPVDAMAVFSLDKSEQPFHVAANGTAVLRFRLPAPTAETTKPCEIQFKAGVVEAAWRGELLCERKPVVLYDGFLKDYKACARKRVPGGEAEVLDLKEVDAHCDIMSVCCGGEYKRGFFMHPPWLKGTTGCSYAYLELNLPDEKDLIFHASIGKKDGTALGDGIRFMVCVAEPGKPEVVVADKTHIEYKWVPFEADLSPWRGKKVTLRLVSDVGPAGDSSGDHSGWAEMAIQKRETVLVYSLR